MIKVCVLLFNFCMLVNPFVHLMKFTCVIFHLFLKVAQFLYHGTHFSGHNVYAFVTILGCLVQSTNDVTLLVCCPNKETSINVLFWRAAVEFWNVGPKPIIVVKTFNKFTLPFTKGLHWNHCLWYHRNDFLMEGIMGWILLLFRRFITNNTNELFIKYQNRSRNITLQICVVRDTWFLDKQKFYKQLTILRLCLYIFKGWRETPINII